MKITIIGSGYVSLVSAICLAKIGHNVISVDNDKEKIDNLNRGIVPIFEPNLTELLSEVKALQKITFTANLEQAIIDYAAFFTNQLSASNVVDLGNLGHLNIQNETYTFESNYNSAHYFQPVQLEKVQIEDQTENNFNTSSKQWWILPLIIATIAIVAILLK